MKVLSLFSGLGAFDLGLERAGMEIVGQVEIDPVCQRVLRHHWPDVWRAEDVRIVQRVGCGLVEREPAASTSAGGRDSFQRGAIDLICGGFPCQDVSVAGKRAGLDGARSGLWFEFHRILRELRPRWALIENVPGLLSSNSGRDFGVILAGLDELGFGVAWAVLDSQHFGVPQRRRRVFVVAGPTRRSAEQVLALCESCGGHPPAGRTAGQDVAGALGGGAQARGWADDTDRMTTFVPEVSYALSASVRHTGDGHGNAWNTTYAVRSAQTGSNGWGVNEDGIAYTLDGAQQAVAFALGSHAGSNGNASNESHAAGGPAGMGINEEITPAIRSGRTQAIASTSVRRLTPTECLRLQGLPDDWLDLGPPLADGPKYRMVGNAVTVPVIEYIARRILEAEGAVDDG